MLQYCEKGVGQHTALHESLGCSIWEQDGVWVTDGDVVAVQVFLDAYQADPLEFLPEINRRCEEAIAQLKAGYPESEILSWAKQEQEARSGGGPMLTALALARGVPLSVLCERIIHKADSFAALSGRIIGIRQSLEDRIVAGEVGVTWPDA